MARGLPEWPDPTSYEDWREWARAAIRVFNEQLEEDVSEIGQIAYFAVSLPENGRFLPATGGTFVSASFPELAQKLGTTFSPAPPAGHTRLPNESVITNHIAGIRAI